MTQILVIDTETTGLLPDNPEVLEVALVQVDLVSGERLVLVNTLVQPSKPGWQSCWFMINSKLDPWLFSTAPRIEEVMPKLQEHFDRLPVTSFNRVFDLSVLHVDLPEFPCLMLKCTPILCLPGRYGNGYKWPSLKEAWQYFSPGVEFHEEHRALPDAMYAAEVAIQLAKRKREGT